MSVVEGDYEKEFKKFNLNQLYGVRTQDEKPVTKGAKERAEAEKGPDASTA